MPIRDWPLEERPREKLLARGASAMSDAELLAIFLRTGVKGKTAVDLAREMLNEFGGLRALLEADLKTFCRTKGLGTAKYVQLQACLEMSRRFLFAGLSRGDALTDPQAIRDYLKSRLRGHAREVFACLFLDARLRAISFDELFHGTIDSATVYPREVVKRALMHNASAVVMAHQHPSGVAEPSRADKDLTRQLVDALALIEVRTLDHFVIGDTEVISFAECGLL